ncbi:MAG: metallophosphoesterase, partial [Terracidiphilus sp.]
MSVLIVQLSDIHFAGAGDKTANRVNALKQAILAKAPTSDACFLVFTGDIACTGAPEEYEVASRFISALKDGLLASRFESVHAVVVPGNHDLNLRAETDTRQSVLESPEAYLRKGVNLDGLNFEAIIEVEDDFFRFEASVSGHPPLKNSEKLYFRRAYQVGTHSLLFHCFNTAWLSRKNEVQAKLYLPEQILTGATPAETTMSVAIFHHPYNWLDAGNQRLLKNFVESQADLVLTGHEHEAGADRYLSMKGQGLDYLAAPAFNDPSIQSNGFQMLLADFESDIQQIFKFEWDGIRFTETNAANWTLRRNSRRQTSP